MVLSMMTDQQRQRPSTTEIGRQSCEQKYGLVERGRQDDDDVNKMSAVATFQLTPRRDPLIRNPPVSASLTLVLSSYRSIHVSQSHHTPTHTSSQNRGLLGKTARKFQPLARWHSAKTPMNDVAVTSTHICPTRAPTSVTFHEFTRLRPDLG
ncbi:hypothetical protein GQ607_002999 [Colletotrichum asianum]|uniref:Uncharacterized protein n=1 Tax=Colletotrichum asianum TaxID=702518 RepID=A0A8H3WPW4_9PEZI|nr:hypothetical protein GQ607_002999 [Colletotrichum asianum]